MPSTSTEYRSSQHCFDPSVPIEDDPTQNYCDPPVNPRREQVRNTLSKQFTKELKEKMQKMEPEIEYRRSLKAVEIVRSIQDYRKNQKQFPMHDENSKPVLFWNEVTKPKEHYKRSSDMTKLNSEYLGDKQWR